MSSKCILIIDDEIKMRRLLQDAFEAKGYETVEADSAAQAWDIIAGRRIDLITLDLNLPDQDGLAIAREIRSRRNIPIIIISSRIHPIDRALGLEAGADDYIIKPFHLRELFVRVSLVLERYNRSLGSGGAPLTDEKQTKSSKYHLNGWIIDPKRRKLSTRDGQDQELTSAEFDLLQLFLKHPNRVISRDELVRALYDREWLPHDRRIDKLVSRLRSRVETDSKTPNFIKTVRSIGYVLAADVEPLDKLESSDSNNRSMQAEPHADG